MMPLRISRLRCGLTPRRFGGTALSINANCSSLSQNRSAIVLLHGNRSVESGLLESGQALETWELGFEPSFVAAGSVGFIWLLAWVLAFNTPERVRWLGAAERQKIL